MDTIPDTIPAEYYTQAINIRKKLVNSGLIFESDDYLWNAVSQGIKHPHWPLQIIYESRHNSAKIPFGSLVTELKQNYIHLNDHRIIVRSHILTLQLDKMRESEANCLQQKPESRYLLPNTDELGSWPFPSFDRVLQFRTFKFDTHSSNQIRTVARFTRSYKAIKCEIEYWLRNTQPSEWYTDIVTSFLYTCTEYMFDDNNYILPELTLPIEEIRSTLTSLKECKQDKYFYAHCSKKSSLDQFLQIRKRQPVYRYLVHKTNGNDYLCAYEPCFRTIVDEMPRHGGIIWSRPGKGLTTHMLHYALKQPGKILYICSEKDIAIVYHFYTQSKLLNTKKVTVLWEDKRHKNWYKTLQDDMIIVCGEYLREQGSLKRHISGIKWDEVIWDTGLDQQDGLSHHIYNMEHIQTLWIIHHKRQGDINKYAACFRLYELFGLRDQFKSTNPALSFGFYRNCSYFYNHSNIPENVRLTMHVSFEVDYGISYDMLYVTLREVCESDNSLKKIQFLELLNQIQNGARCSKRDIFQQFMKFSNNIMPGGKTYNPLPEYHRLTPMEPSQIIEKHDVCIICMDPPSKLVYNSGCEQHPLCYECMERCVREKSECPLCRRAFLPTYYRIEPHSIKKRKVEEKSIIPEHDLADNKLLSDNIEKRIKQWLGVCPKQTILLVTQSNSMLTPYHHLAKSCGTTLFIPGLLSGRNWKKAKQYYKKCENYQIIVTHAANIVYLRSFPFSKVVINGFYTTERIQWIIDKYFMHADIVVQGYNRMSIGYFLHKDYECYPEKIRTSDEWLQEYKKTLDG